MDYNFDWSVVRDSLPDLLVGLLTTVEISLIVIVLSMLLAVPVALMRMSQISIVRWIAQVYIEIFRCTPLLVQLFWIFYAMPTLTGITLPGFASAVIALTANLTAFMAEAYRSGFQAVPIEQVEAGQMLRLTTFERIRYIIVPQALRQQLPVILSLNISLFKDTALVSTIAVADLMFIANNISAETYRSLELLSTAALLYFVVAFPVSLITSRIERNMMNKGQRTKTGPSVLARMVPGTRVKTA
ncbi:amino acid ABC transporter permease [Microbacterium sp. SA39]|uniref:amino acid ABC transporter permease n=1 Tax=Microbacterium sp. SA39 TaxID=1263625 RepID=UPI0006201D8F|nr:amino acid ABC transporter permease [Microbacterium sp. SA39]KJQ55802.1 Inner membrane amino-acid ABC transporter permease protein YecS [Microbacterium sp. SA39]